MKNYTYIWNQSFIAHTRNIGRSNLIIEIGCFEGLTSNYIVENLLSENGLLICVDPLMDTYIGEEHKGFEYFSGQYERFIANTKEHMASGKIELFRGFSNDFFSKKMDEIKGKVDFIYVDGDHREEAVFSDAENSFSAIKNGGCILFDDYKWTAPSGILETKNGIDRFLSKYVGQYDKIINSDQVMIRAKK